MIDADKITATTRQQIPTGELTAVADTPFDFRAAHAVGLHLAEAHGYDHCFVLNTKDGLRQAATVYDPGTGRAMEVLTTEPSIQFYTANYLSLSIVGKGNKPYKQYGALCLETQHYPDSPNHPEFPSTELKPGDTFHSTTIYKFTSRAAQ